MADLLGQFDMGYFTDLVKAVGRRLRPHERLPADGRADGKVTANHDNAAIVGATIAMTDTHDLYVFGRNG